MRTRIIRHTVKLRAILVQRILISRKFTGMLILIGMVLVGMSWWMRGTAPPENTRPGPGVYSMESSIRRAFAPEHHSHGLDGDLDRDGDIAFKGGNLYETGGTWVNQHGDKIDLGDLKGRPAVFAFIYTSCEDICPALVASLRLALEDVPEPLRRHARYLLFSFDPVRDSPAVMREYQKIQGLTGDQWVLLTANEAVIRPVAELAGFKWRPNGRDFSHNMLVAVADAQGEIRGRFTQGLGLSKPLARSLAHALSL